MFITQTLPELMSIILAV